MRRKLIGTVTLALAFAFAGALPASAVGSEDNDANREADLPHVNYEVDGNEVELEFVNPTDFTFSFDYRVDGQPEGTEDEWTNDVIGEGPLEGQEFGLRYEVVTLEAQETAEVTVLAESEVEVRLARGAEQSWYFDWITIEVEDVDDPEAPEDPELPEDPREPQRPEAKQECKNGGWEELGHRNQGLCVASVVANERAGF